MLVHFNKVGKWVCNGTLLLVAIIILLMLALSLVTLNPALPSIQCEGSKLVDPRISHRFKGDTVTALHLLIFIFIIPFTQILITELIVPLKNNSNKFSPSVISSSDITSSSTYKTNWKHGTFSAFRWFRDYIYGIIFMLVVVDVGKTTLKAPRPHFIHTCQPKFIADDCKLGWVENYECMNSNNTKFDLYDSAKSFPSGHAALAIYCAVFMILYQHRRLCMRRHGSIAVLWCHLSWLAWGLFCALSRVADHRHHPIDITIGGIIGGIGAVLTVIYLCEHFYDNLQFDFDSDRIKTLSHSTGSHAGIVNCGAVVLDMDITGSKTKSNA